MVEKIVIRECEASRKKFIGPKKGQFPETDDAVFMFSEDRRKTGINCIVLLLKHSGSIIFPKSWS
jgi:hypothetical protein